MRPCLDCGALTHHPRCAPCGAAHRRMVDAARDAKRGNRHQRGLGSTHVAQRRALLKAAGTITACPRCGAPITADNNPITAEHTTPRAHGGQAADTLICRRCNSRDGGALAHAH